jgi:ATP-dependent Lhr-like helicase
MDDKALFDSLPYFLRAYISRKGWSRFREVQVRAFETLRESDGHLLIASGTSSGKTEAAFLPVLSAIDRDRPKGISVLYVSPLKALVDDQFERLSMMTEGSSIELHSWHGDISASKKRKVLEDGTGILQITPESLDNIVNKHYGKLQHIFGDLRFVIIDEVHSFMNSDRGLQLLCQLNAILRIAGCSPRRIGLSATLSDFSSAVDWLRAGEDRSVEVIDLAERPDYDLTIRFTRLAPKDSDERQNTLC